MNNNSSRKPKAEPVSISECMFGPSKQYPNNISEAILATATSSFDITPRSSPKSSSLDGKKKTFGNETTGSHEIDDDDDNTNTDYLAGIDGLDQSRWGAHDAAAQAIPNNSLDHVVKLSELRRLASQGFVDQGSHRAVAWRLLLGYLPVELSQWKETLLKQRTLYRNLVAELFVEPEHDGNELRGHHGKRHKAAQRQKEYVERMNHKKQLRDSDDEGEDYRGKHFEDNSDIHHTGSNSGDDDDDDDDNDDKLETASTDNDTPALTEEGTNETAKSTNDENETTTTDADTVDNNDANDGEGTNGMHDSFPTPTDAGRPLIDSEAEGDKNTDSEQPQQQEQSPSKDAVHDDNDDDDDQQTGPQVPAKIKEEWRKSGRDAQTLDNISRGEGSMNTLLVNEHPRLTGSAGRVEVHKDPLSTDTESKWFQFFENASLLDEIRKDVVRTHPDLYFFLEPEDSLGQRRYAALERILFVWSKLNKGVSEPVSKPGMSKRRRSHCSTIGVVVAAVATAFVCINEPNIGASFVVLTYACLAHPLVLHTLHFPLPFPHATESNTTSRSDTYKV